MKVYRTDEIRNVVLLGHGGSGKTSLAEAMAYVSGATNRMGKITDGNTISDFDKEEQKREFSISTSLIPIEWEKAKINILDTPGYFDFVGEVEEAVSAADAAVIVVSGKAGVEVGTEKAWELCDKYKLPRMVYVTEMDVDDASFRQVVQDLTDRYGKVIAPHFQPIRENEKLVGYVNVIKNAARRYTGVGQREECEIPEYCKPNLEIYRDKLLEAVAETSEAFMERYFDGDEFSVEEIRSAMRTEVMDGDIVPVAMGSNIQAQGVANLLSDIVRFFPSPDNRSCAGINRKTNEIFEGNYDFAKAKSAYVFKTMVDPFIGKYSFIKTYIMLIVGATALITLNIHSMFPSMIKAFRYAIFQVVTVITTTGYATTDFAKWPMFSKSILMMLTVVGACASSTGGGIKVSRLLVGIKCIKREIVQLAHPKSVGIIRIGGKKVGSDILRTIYIYFIAYVGILIVSVMLVSLDNFDFETTFSAVLTTLGNVGPGMAKVGPMGNFADFSILSKLVLCFDMLAGRLEIFPFLVLFTAPAWRRKF